MQKVFSKFIRQQPLQNLFKRPICFFAKDHPVYKRVSEKDADACAWVFSDNKTFEKYYYKHPELAKDDVRVRILSSGLCMTDSHTCREHWGKCAYFPISPGHEIVGVVEAVGKDIKEFKNGEKVMLGPFRDSCGNCEFCLKGWTNACTGMGLDYRFIYGYYWGGYSTHCQLNKSHVFKLPSNLDYKNIASLMCAGITTFLPLYQYAKKGDRVAIIGAGGLGHFGIQFAHKMGLKVDVFSSSHSKDELIKKLGGQKIYNWVKNEHESLKDYYDCILNTLPVAPNRDQLHSILNTLKPYGKFLQVGIPDIANDLEVQYFDLVAKSIQICGSLVGGIKHYQDMLDFVAKHGIECIAEHYEFDDFPKALDKLENGKPIFRCIVDTEKFSDKFKPKKH